MIYYNILGKSFFQDGPAMPAWGPHRAAARAPKTGPLAGLRAKVGAYIADDARRCVAVRMIIVSAGPELEGVGDTPLSVFLVGVSHGCAEPFHGFQAGVAGLGSGAPVLATAGAASANRVANATPDARLIECFMALNSFRKRDRV